MKRQGEGRQAKTQRAPFSSSLSLLTTAPPRADCSLQGQQPGLLVTVSTGPGSSTVEGVGDDCTAQAKGPR